MAADDTSQGGQMSPLTAAAGGMLFGSGSITNIADLSNTLLAFMLNCTYNWKRCLMHCIILPGRDANEW